MLNKKKLVRLEQKTDRIMTLRTPSQQGVTEVYVPSAVRPVVPAGRKRVASAPLELVRTIDTNGNLVAPIERLGMAGERGVVVGWCLVNMRGGTVVSPKLGQA
jgi:hypothetical protein